MTSFIKGGFGVFSRIISADPKVQKGTSSPDEEVAYETKVRLTLTPRTYEVFDWKDVPEKEDVEKAMERFAKQTDNVNDTLRIHHRGRYVFLAWRQLLTREQRPHSSDNIRMIVKTILSKCRYPCFTLKTGRDPAFWVSRQNADEIPGGTEQAMRDVELRDQDQAREFCMCS